MVASIFFFCICITIMSMTAADNTTTASIQAQNVTEEDFEFLDSLEFINVPDLDSESYDRADSSSNATSGNFTSASSSSKKCVPRSACYKDFDCGGQKGKSRCVGIFVGKCDCTACVSGLPCSSAATCGGLQNSCGNVTGICDCIKAHKENGFANFGQALIKFCNRQDCDEDSDTCFGLPCRRGRCVCL